VQNGADHVVCDIHLFETVLKNLLYNASPLCLEPHQRDIHLAEGLNELLVEDDGPGIPAQERSRVFQSFVQLTPPPARRWAMVLGLAIVKRAIEWHGGQVDIGILRSAARSCARAGR